MRARLLRKREAGRTIVVTSQQREDVELLADVTYRIDRQTLEQVSSIA